MSEDKESLLKQEVKKQNFKIYLIVGFAVLVVAVITLGILYYNLNAQSKLLRADLESSTTKMEACLEINKQREAELEKAKAELEKSKARIAGIKNNDDLLKRDIELYIRHTYRKVPKSVAKTIAEFLVDQSKKEDVSAELMVGIIQVESQFNPMAVGPKTKYGHARGLMQVMPEWAKKFGLDTYYDLHDIDTNITCGIKVFKIHLEEGRGKISEGLYLYVNKDRAYVDKVYNAMGKFVSFRSTVDDDDKSEEEAAEPNGNGDEKEKSIEPVAGAKKSS